MKALAKTLSGRRQDDGYGQHSRDQYAYNQPRSSPLPSNAYSDPRKPPPPPKPSQGFLSAAFRSPGRANSAASLRSAFSDSSSSIQTPAGPDSSSGHHPYGAMAAAPVPVVSSRWEEEDDAECPVCLEPLSFSFRLPGEKPHIVPECGHALHEACFTAVYGPAPGARGSVARNRNLGVCGVCRRPMKLGDGDSGGKSNKLAALTGMSDRGIAQQQTLYPGRHGPVGGRGTPAPKPYDPTEDDALESIAAARGGGDAAYVVAPSITVRPEFSTLTRSGEPSQPLTCILVVELPGKRNPAAQPRPVPPESYSSRNNVPRMEAPRSAMASPRAQPEQFGQYPAPLRAFSPAASEGDPYSPRSLQHRMADMRSPSAAEGSYREAASVHERGPDAGYESDPPPFEEAEPEDEPVSSAFQAITDDLRNRIVDWKGHPLSQLGALQMYDMLRVRRDTIIREFFVYLFKEAIICVMEERRRTLGRLLSGTNGPDASGERPHSRGVLRLKGRIYIRHIRQVADTSTASELSLTIDMEDERLESFILVFRDRPSLETWKRHVQRLVELFRRQNPAALARAAQARVEAARVLDIEEFGGSAKAARMLSGGTLTSANTTLTNTSNGDSLLNSARSISSSHTSHQSHASPAMGPSARAPKLAPLGEDEELSQYDPSAGFVVPHSGAGPSNALPPAPHPPLDLILVISVPPPGAVPSTAALKVRVLKNTLDFALAQLGPRDRLSLVTFEMGAGGAVRKTPFLSPSKTQSRARLAKFIDEIGFRHDEDSSKDEFAVRIQDEKTDVVTAINHGLDVVLQRKGRNPVSGMILVSDAADTTRKAQMDLVLARAEAANMPIHSFGYGRSHDPASLWLVSNNTGGTYTFVRDWYDLQACVAGCVGGMMSMGLLNMKLHLRIVDGNHFAFRKVSGGPSTILSSDGKHIDIDLGELRYGERKEMLVELDLDNTDARERERALLSGGGAGGPRRAMNATDQFVAQMGLDSLAMGDNPDLADGLMDRMIEEMPVFEVDGGFLDPAAGKTVSRLAHPVLLTVTLMPQPSARSPRPPAGSSDPIIVRRRMEILAGDMITRALVLVSRKNPAQAQTILGETKRVLSVVLSTVSAQLPPPGAHTNGVRNRKEILTLATVRCIQAMLQDLQTLSEALEENPDLFAHDQRNFGAQQAMILRDQKAWTGRSAIERVFWTIDHSIELATRSADWVARDH